MSTTDRWAKAIHESGHVVVALALKRRVKAATVVPNGDIGGSVVLEVPADGERMLAAASSSTVAVAYLIVWLWSSAGEAAMKVAALDTWGCESDREYAYEALDALWDLTGCPPWRLRFLLDGTLERYLRANWNGVVRIAATLYDRGSLTGAELLDLAGPLPVLDLTELQGVVRFWGRAPARPPACTPERTPA